MNTEMLRNHAETFGINVDLATAYADFSEAIRLPALGLLNKHRKPFSPRYRYCKEGYLERGGQLLSESDWLSIDMLLSSKQIERLNLGTEQLRAVCAFLSMALHKNLRGCIQELSESKILGDSVIAVLVAGGAIKAADAMELNLPIVSYGSIA